MLKSQTLDKQTIELIQFVINTIRIKHFGFYFLFFLSDEFFNYINTNNFIKINNLLNY